MGKILVTGATGNLGHKTLQHLSTLKPVSELVGLGRNAAKAVDQQREGIEIRQADYFDYEALLAALQGIEKVLLISAHAFTDRAAQHTNVIRAAQEVGVRQMFYTSIIRAEGSTFSMPEVTPGDLATERALEESGLDYTIIGHPPFMEFIPSYFNPDALQTGLRMPSGGGKVASATRGDLAEAQAAILAQQGTAGRRYDLYGDPATSFADMAEILTEVSGHDVPSIPITNQQYIDRFLAAGSHELSAQFVLAWVRGMAGGEWDKRTSDLEDLLRRKPVALSDYLGGAVQARR